MVTLNFGHDFVLAAVAADFKLGEGLRVVLADALGDVFELLGHAPHVVVVATGYHRGALDVSAYQDLRFQQDQPSLNLTAEESFHGCTPFTWQDLLQPCCK